MDSQKVNFSRPTTCISGFTLEVSKLYYLFSNMDLVDEKLKEYPIDKRVQPIVDVLAQGAKREFKPTYLEEYPVRQFNEDLSANKNVIVCFSGGKDSTAAALLMKEKGYNVYLYHVHGINKSYPEELERAQSVAKILGMPMVTENVTLKGTSTFRDNPIKNQLIASMALEYGIENKISTTIVFGDFTTDNVNNCYFLECFSDSQEMWLTHRDYIKQYVPYYEVVIPFKTYIDTMDIIAEHKDLLNIIQGCVLPYRYRKGIRAKNETKYNVQLLPNRCGSCWKCCVEYIHYANKGIVEYNKEFYKHCLDFLTGKMALFHPDMKQDIETVYKVFLYADYKDSKYYQDK